MIPYEEDDDLPSPYGFSPYSGGCILPVCPKCHSPHIETRNRARKIGCAVGAIAGAISAVVVAGFETGANVVRIVGPTDPVYGNVASTIVAALVGATAGGTTGVRLGEVIDEKVLDNYLCHHCGHAFSLRHS